MSVNTVAISPIIGCELEDTALSTFMGSFCMGDPQIDVVPAPILGCTIIPVLEGAGSYSSQSSIVIMFCHIAIIR